MKVFIFLGIYVLGFIVNCITQALSFWLGLREEFSDVEPMTFGVLFALMYVWLKIEEKMEKKEES